MFFIFWDEVFDLASEESKACFGKQLPFWHCFMAHAFVSFSSWVTENRKWERAKLLKELLDKASLRRGNGNNLKSFCFYLIDTLAQLRQISSADWSAKVADKYDHRVLAVQCL